MSHCKCSEYCKPSPLQLQCSRAHHSFPLQCSNWLLFTVESYDALQKMVYRVSYRYRCFTQYCLCNGTGTFYFTLLHQLFHIPSSPRSCCVACSADLNKLNRIKSNLHPPSSRPPPPGPAAPRLHPRSSPPTAAILSLQSSSMYFLHFSIFALLWLLNSSIFISSSSSLTPWDRKSTRLNSSH